MGLRKVWEKKKKECLPGTKEDFLKFLKIDKDDLQRITYLELPNLPGIKGEAIDEGIFTEQASESFIWRWRYMGRTIEGRGESYLDAGFDGLIICWIISADKKEE